MYVVFISLLCVILYCIVTTSCVVR